MTPNDTRLNLDVQARYCKPPEANRLRPTANRLHVYLHNDNPCIDQYTLKGIDRSDIRDA